MKNLVRDFHIIACNFKIFGITETVFDTKVIIIKNGSNFTSTHLYWVDRAALFDILNTIIFLFGIVKLMLLTKWLIKNIFKSLLRD